MEEERKNTAPYSNGRDPYAHSLNEELPPDDEANQDCWKEPEPIKLRSDEAALDLWTFELDKKAETWDVAGLYRTGIVQLLESAHFNKRYHRDQQHIFWVRGTAIIEKVSDTVMRDHVRAYIEQTPEPLKAGHLEATYEGRLEIFKRQHHLIINDKKGLEVLKTHERPFLRDTATTCYLPYSNGIVQITANELDAKPYSILAESCIWKTQVLAREVNLDAPTDCHFARFIANISNHEPDRIQAFRSAIGYLIHHYGNPTEGQAVICYDQEINAPRKPEGGTGKGVFANAIWQVRPVARIDGKKFDPNDRFCFQEVNEDSAVVWIDDPVVNHTRPERRFTLERFFSLLTEGWAIEKKNQHAFRIPPKEGPKLLISSNVVMSNEGSSNVRRQFILEFGPHYKSQIRRGNEKPIETEHGCAFFSNDWNAEEWQRFDRYMIGCVQDYLRDGLQPYDLRSAEQNHLRQIAGEDFHEWVTTYQKTGLVADVPYSRDGLWSDYRAFAGISDTGKIPRSFSDNVARYAKTKGLKFNRGTDTRNITFTLTRL
jgi:hypothetical protein